MSKYCLIFLGEIHESFLLDKVRDNFKKIFKLTDSQAKYLFSGKELTIKKDLSQNEALRYAMQIDEIGGICYIEPMDPDIELPEGVSHDRRIQERRMRTKRRTFSRGSIRSDRRLSTSRERRKKD